LARPADSDLFRLVTSFATTAAQVDEFLAEVQTS